jgi:hypothetical protein
MEEDVQRQVRRRTVKGEPLVDQDRFTMTCCTHVYEVNEAIEILQGDRNNSGNDEQYKT